MAALIPAAPAQAATSWTMNDQRYDAPRGIDIKSTTLSVGTPGYYRVAVRGYNFRRARLNVVEVYFDTNAADTGPEYGIGWALPGDGDGIAYIELGRIDRWNGQGYSAVRCDLAQRINYDTEVAVIWVPRSCLSRPAQLRWNVTTWDFTEYDENRVPTGGHYDAVPSWRRFSRWVA